MCMIHLVGLNSIVIHVVDMILARAACLLKQIFIELTKLASVQIEICMMKLQFSTILIVNKYIPCCLCCLAGT